MMGESEMWVVRDKNSFTWTAERVGRKVYTDVRNFDTRTVVRCSLFAC
jgi:hypothetical protein